MTAPVLATTRHELAALLDEHRRAGRKVGFVPTMGALHSGHASLMAEAKARVDGPVVVSIFVNPTQFAPGEDFERYPRTLDEDLKLCAEQGVDVVFAPAVDEVYPHGTAGADTISIQPGALATVLEGKVRPTHFAGVLTVVAKLFGLVKPDLAVFGEKDYQQLTLIRRMADDLCLGVEVVGAETIRESDGLALSSRNRYLDGEQRREAVILSRALYAAQGVSQWGLSVAIEAARAELRRAKSVDLDYLVVRAVDLSELPAEYAAGTPARILIAARVGSTRLIDNLPLSLGAPDSRTANSTTVSTHADSQEGSR